MKPVIPDYDWSIFGVRVRSGTCLHRAMLVYWEQVSGSFRLAEASCIARIAHSELRTV